MHNILVGYWLSDEKEDKLNFVQFVKYCSQKGIELIRTELREDMQRPPQFALFIHKLNDLVVDAEKGDDSAIERLTIFDRWTAFYPQVDIIDALPCTRVLLNRLTMSKMIEKTCLNLDESVFFIPPFCELATQADILDDRIVRQHGLEFPLICKPIMAESHDIVVITDERGLALAPIPCLAQTFISHFQLLFKLYILGDKLFCVERPSLPDPAELGGMGPVLRFNTAMLGKGPPSAFDADRKKIFIADAIDPAFQRNGVLSNGSFSTDQNGSCNSTASGKSNGWTEMVRPAPATLQILATALRAELNLELFGADVIVDAATGRLACIDVNTFPGYKGVPDFFAELASFLLRRARNEISLQSQMPIFIS